MFRPMLACDYDSTKVEKHLPLYLQPKIDGVRGLNLDGKLMGRSLKPFRNAKVTELFSIPEFHGFDGELWATTQDATAPPTSPSLCRDTTSELNSKVADSNTVVRWTIFDYITEATKNLPYKNRLLLVKQLIENMQDFFFEDSQHPVHWVRVIEYKEVSTLADITSTHSRLLTMGYEGSILRNPSGLYKQGRSTIKEAGLLRVKDFQDAEAVVIHIRQGYENNNPIKMNELGYSARSTHKEYKEVVPVVGSLVCRSMVDGSIISVGPGAMTPAEREYYWYHQDELLGKTIKFKYFAHGMKDKPRFPTFVCIREDTDMLSY